jgi:hypothetical protein
MEREPRRRLTKAVGGCRWIQGVEGGRCLLCETDVIVIHPDLHGVDNPPVQTVQPLPLTAGSRKRRTSRFARRRQPSNKESAHVQGAGHRFNTPITGPTHSRQLFLGGRFLAFGFNSVRVLLKFRRAPRARINSYRHSFQKKNHSSMG